jgi:hypothetical protein
MDLEARIIHEINTSPFNRGLCGADWLANTRNVVAMVDDGFALFDDLGGGLFAIHLFLRSTGKEAVAAVRTVTETMFLHGAQMIVGHIPVINRKVAVIGRMAGYHYAGRTSTPHGDVLVYLIAPEIH